jgi:hypothetical protein
MRIAVPPIDIIAISRTLPFVGAVADPPTVAPQAPISCPAPSDPPTGSGAGVEPFTHEAGVFTVAPDVAPGMGVAFVVAPGVGGA